MPTANSSWQKLPLSLNGVMDTRSRPSDLPAGAFRFKLNMSINRSGKLSRRAGFGALDFGLRSDDPLTATNWDFHRRGRTREEIRLLYESSSPENVRRLFAGTQSNLSYMDNDTSEWTDIATGMGAENSRWKAASLRDKIVFTNDVDDPQLHVLASSTTADIPELQARGVRKAKVVVQYQNVIILMNLEAQDYDAGGSPAGGYRRLSNRMIWSDYRDATKWTPGGDSVAGFLDLDDGEQILNAAELGGILYIFTDRAIWKLFLTGAVAGTDSIFGANRWYAEPKNRTGCLAYENSLVSTGREFYWMGRETLYFINQFSTAPSSPDWLLKASGRMFEGEHRIDPAYCASPIGNFAPDATGNAKEVWFSYPQLGGDTGINDYSLVLSFNTDSTTSPYQTADHVDHGFSAFTTFSPSSASGTCNVSPVFVGASGEDWCLKSIGTVFERTMVTLIGLVSVDIPDLAYVTTAMGYYSQIVGLCPFALSHREKILRGVLLEHDSVDQAVPNILKLRIGNSFKLSDPMPGVVYCGVQWHNLDDRELACPDEANLETMETEGTRPDGATEWTNEAEQGNYLYFDLKITDPAGNAPIGSDSAFNSANFDFLVLP